MSQILSNSHRDVVVNGTRQEGWAEEDRPVEWGAGNDFFDLKTGQDGGMYGQSIPMFGNTATLRYAPTSPNCQYWVNENEYRKQSQLDGRRNRYYEITDSDLVQGRSMRGEGGVLLQCTEYPEPGQTFEVQLKFERTVPNVDGATFTPPFTTPSN